MSNGEEQPGDPDLYRTVAQMVPGQSILGRYTLTRILGRGGFGVVWEVHDNELDMDVAIKFLSDIIVSNPEAVDDLKRETKFSLRLTHPNIVRIYGFVQDPTVAGISMEYVDGGTLSALKVKRPNRCFDVETLAPLTERLCDALEYAHKRVKIAHRDLKPGNLMVDSSGDLKVADFGISRSISDTQTALTHIASSGTPAFMSPQQMMGEPASHSDDLYSLGGTLYDLLAGKPPFYTGNIVEQVRTMAPATIAARREELGIEAPPVPPEWEEVIRACLEKEVANRPSSAAEVASRLGLRISGAATLPVALADGSSQVDVSSGVATDGATPPGSRIPTSPSMGAAAPSSETMPSAGSVSGIPVGVSSAGGEAGPVAKSPRPRWILPVAVGVVGALAAGGWWFTRSGSTDVSSLQVRGDVASSSPVSSLNDETADSATASGGASDSANPVEGGGTPAIPSETGSSLPNQSDLPSGVRADGNPVGKPGEASPSSPDLVEGEVPPQEAAATSTDLSGALGSDGAGSGPDEGRRQIEDARNLLESSIRRGSWDRAESSLSTLRALSPEDAGLRKYEAQIDDGREVQQLRREIRELLAAGRTGAAGIAVSTLLDRRPGDREATRWRQQLAEAAKPVVPDSKSPAGSETTTAPVSDDRAKIQSLLVDYEEALETVDLGRFVGLWSELSNQKRSKFEKAFKAIARQNIDLVGASAVSIEGAKATVRLREKRKMTMKAGQDLDVEVQSVLSLVRIGGVWKIEDLEARSL